MENPRENIRLLVGSFANMAGCAVILAPFGRYLLNSGSSSGNRPGSTPYITRFEVYLLYNTTSWNVSAANKAIFTQMPVFIIKICTFAHIYCVSVPSFKANTSEQLATFFPETTAMPVPVPTLPLSASMQVSNSSRSPGITGA